MAPKGNEYKGAIVGGKGGRWVGLTTLTFSCAELSRNPGSPPAALWACPGL